MFFSEYKVIKHFYGIHHLIITTTEYKSLKNKDSFSLFVYVWAIKKGSEYERQGQR